jgi:methyl-branched lipid omega-hydroxylase
MIPREELSIEEIRLSDPDFWRHPEEVIEGAFVTLRREAPVSFHEEIGIPPLFEKGPGYWSVVKHADIERVSRDGETFRASPSIAIWDFPPEFAKAFHHMGNEDGERHARLRRIVSRAFSAGAMRRLEDVIEQVARETVDRIIVRGEIDFVEDVGGQLPVRMICELIGIPDSYHQMVYEMSGKAMTVADPMVLAGAVDIGAALGSVGQAAMSLMGMAHELYEARSKEPRDDVISLLINAGADGEALTEEEFVQFVVLLTVAGNDTTRSALANGMLALSRHPDQRQLWLSDLDGHAELAANEIIRWASPVMHFRRTAASDAAIGDQEIKQGEKVVLWYRSGNFDEEAIADPYRFDITRPLRPSHVAFGGPDKHHCLGEHLARREVAIMFRELLSRIPDIEVIGEPRRSGGSHGHAIHELRCSFTPGGDRVPA